MARLQNPSALQRLLRVLGQTTATLAVVGLAAVVLVAGVGILGDRAAAVPEPDAAAPVPVSVKTVQFETGYTIARHFAGQVEARASVSLSFELAGQLKALSVAEGDTVAQGQEIARLDTDLLDAEATRLKASRAAAAAQLAFAESRLSRAVSLQDRGFTSQETLDQALAARDELTNRIAETDAALATVAINIEKSVLHAPFAGRVAAQPVDIAETISAGQEIAVLMETTAPEVRIGLPLGIGETALERAQVAIAGTVLPATLKRMRPDIDPVTRTRTALFAIPADADALFGQTATLLLQTRVAATGVWVPLDALQSGKGSVWTVMVVDDDRLRPAAVEILHIDGRRAYVQGSIDAGTRLVVAGAHRVVAGQRVTTVDAEG